MALDAIAGSVSFLYFGFSDRVAVEDSEEVSAGGLAASVEDTGAAVVRLAAVAHQEDGNING